MSGAWSALLAGPRAEKASEVLHVLCDALSDPNPCWYPEELSTSADYRDAVRAGLNHGYTGLALFWAAIGARDGRAESACYQYLSSAQSMLRVLEVNPSLHEGFLGIAYVFELLRKKYPHWFDGEDINADVDPALLQFLEAGAPLAPADLMGGLAGLGLYLLERQPRQTASICLDRVIAMISERATRDADGIYWESEPHTQSRKFGYLVNTGVAHGVAGIIGFLARAVQQQGPASPAAALLEPAVDWLLRRREDDQEALYPELWNPDRSHFAPRIAWCYGDLSTAVVLVKCGDVTGNRRWSDAGLEAGHFASKKRGPDALWVPDAGLCHGTAGLAHLFNALYQRTGDSVFARSAEHWFDATLARWEPHSGAGVGGFVSFLHSRRRGNAWSQNPGILQGAAGIGLALMSSLAGEPPVWDRHFLADLSC